MCNTLPFDPRLLEQASSGGRGGDHPPCVVAVPDDGDEREQRFTALAAVEAELKSLFEDAPEDLTMLLKLYGGELSYRELGTRMGVNASTACRRVHRLLEGRRRARAADLALVCFARGEGFTIDTRRGRLVPVGSVDGFAVSLAGKGRVFQQQPGRDAIKCFLRKHLRLLESAEPKYFFGGWVCDGYHLDLTRLLPTLAQALAFATLHGQRCVFDMKRGIDIFVDGQGQRRAA